MNHQLATIDPPQSRASSAMVEVEAQRAMQEIQASMIIAKRFPRDEKGALDKILNACSRVGLAEQASYSFSRGGTEITGPSIRLLEAVAQYWGNIRTGIVEVSRGVDAKGVTTSEAKAYAWDVETNFYEEKLFTVPHWRDTKKGGYAITDERDIYELVANMGARRKRACLLAAIPGDVVDEAGRQCEVTLAAKADLSPESITRMAEAFAKMGVTKTQIEKRIQRRLESIVPAQIISLRKIHSSIRDGMSAPGDWFEKDAAENTSKPIAPFEKPAEAAPVAVHQDLTDAPDLWDEESAAAETQSLI